MSIEMFLRTPSHDEISASHLTPDVHVGFCGCGCGEHTERTFGTKRQRNGPYNKYLKGHYHALIRKIKPDWGKQSQRMNKREEVRIRIREVVKNAPPNFCVQQLASMFKDEGFNTQGISRIFSIANCWGELTPLRNKPKVSPPYERRHIDYEFKTEIRLLVNSVRTLCLDEDYEDSEGGRYDHFSANYKTPDQILMDKEDRAEQDMIEKFYANRSIDPFVGRSPVKHREDFKFKTKISKTKFRPFKVTKGAP